MIKGVQSLLARMESEFSVAIRQHIYAEMQDFVSGTLKELLAKAIKHKKDLLSGIVTSIIDTCSDQSAIANDQLNRFGSRSSELSTTSSAKPSKKDSTFSDNFKIDWLPGLDVLNLSLDSTNFKGIAAILGDLLGLARRLINDPIKTHTKVLFGLAPKTCKLQRFDYGIEGIDHFKTYLKLNFQAIYNISSTNCVTFLLIPRSARNSANVYANWATFWP